MSKFVSYSNAAALDLLPARAAEALAPDLIKARDEVLADVALFDSGGDVPEEKRPLDAGFVELPAKLLATKESGELADILAAADRFRGRVDAFVSLGIGGSYMGLRALQEALGDPLHNELPKSERLGPKLYYGGNNADPAVTAATLEHLSRLDDWGIVVISKSGGTLETALAFRLFREALEQQAGDAAAKRVIPVTGGEGSKLRALAEAKGYVDIFPVPEGVGGRFSVLSAVGLVPAAVLGLNVTGLLEGAKEMTECFKTGTPGDCPVLDYVATCHLFEKHLSMDVRVLSTWGDRLEAVGLWYDQLLAESLGKDQRGALPLTVVNTRDLHSRGQQHQEGKRDKLIHNLYFQSPRLGRPGDPGVFRRPGRAEQVRRQDGVRRADRRPRGHRPSLRRGPPPDRGHRPAEAERQKRRRAAPDVHARHGGRGPADRHQPLRPAGGGGVQAEHERDFERFLTRRRAVGVSPPCEPLSGRDPALPRTEG